MNATVGTKAQISFVVATSKNRNGKVSDSEYIASAEDAATPKMANPATYQIMPRSINSGRSSKLSLDAIS